MTTHECSVVAERVVLTGFTTDADVDLTGLRARAESASAAAPRERGPFERFVRTLLAPWGHRGRCIADDLVSHSSAPVDEPQPGWLFAPHAVVGGKLHLPDAPHALAGANLSFVKAKALVVAGEAFTDAHEAPAIDVSNATIDAFSLRRLPRRANLQNCNALRWDVSQDDGADAHDDWRSYRELLDSSTPFAQDVYARLERDFRDSGHRAADVFLKRMGWRLWRVSFIAPALRSPRAFALATAVVLLGALLAFAATPTQRLALVGTIVVFTLAAVAWSPLRDAARDGVRFILGLFVLGPFHAAFGFGVRWWLPLVVSAALLLGVTYPMLLEPRNLASPPAVGQIAEPEPVEALRPAPPELRIGAGEAFWLAIQYHVPVISAESYYHGEIPEVVRPRSGTRPVMFGATCGSGAESGVKAAAACFLLRPFASPEQYTRFVFLSSWLLLPFSLVFAAARLQRKYRLQQG